MGIPENQDAQCASLETVLSHHKLYTQEHQDVNHNKVLMGLDRDHLQDDFLYKKEVHLVLLQYVSVPVEKLLDHSEDPHPFECVD